MPRMLIFLVTVLLATGTSQRVQSAPISIRSEKVGQPPLPLQAVAVRFTITFDPNGNWPEEQSNGMGFERIGRKDRNPEFHELARPIDSGRTMRLIANARHWKIRLREGEQVTSMICSGAEWWEFRPFFEEPGQYTLAWNNYALSPVFTPSHQLDVNVSIPMGNDAAVYERLKKDRTTTSVMLSTYLIPDEPCLKVLEDVVSRFGDSSYADYARFALARGYFKFNLRGKPRSREAVEQRVLKFIESEKADKEVPHIRGVAGLFADCSIPLRGERREIAEKLSSAINFDQQVDPQLIRRLVNLKWTTDDDLQRGQQLLESIKNKDFPFYGNALILLRRLHKQRAPEKAGDVTAILNEEFADHYDWLAEIREEGISPADWRAFRVHKAK